MFDVTEFTGLIRAQGSRRLVWVRLGALGYPRNRDGALFELARAQLRRVVAWPMLRLDYATVRWSRTLRDVNE